MKAGRHQETQNASELEILCSAAELQGLRCSKDQALALDEFGHSFSVQLLIGKTFPKNQSRFLFFVEFPAHQQTWSSQVLYYLSPLYYLSIFLLL